MPAKSAASETRPPMRGNLAEFAATGIASEPTLRKWIAAEPDQPWIIKRGSNGDAYEIDFEGATAAWLAKEAAARDAAAARAAQIDQFAMDLGIKAEGGFADGGLTIAERKQLLEEEVIAIKLGRLRGELVERASVEAAFGDVLVKFRQRLGTFASRLAKRIDLDRGHLTAIERAVDAELAELARMMEEMDFGDDGEDGDGASSAATLEDTAV